MLEYDQEANYSELDGILTLDEFLAEFHYRFKPGQHTIFLGPPGRGKTTLAVQILSYKDMPKTEGLLVSANGPDPVYQKMGLEKEFKTVDGWPSQFLPLELYDHQEKNTGRPFIRRYQPLPKKPEDFVRIRQQNSKILRWFFAKKNWSLYLPDMQLITDPGMMNLGKEVDQLVLTARKRETSIFMDAQAARWLPHSSTDCVQHLFIWRNRDEDSVDRLRKIAGLDKKIMLGTLKQINYHDALWIDVIADEYFILRIDANDKRRW